METLIKKFEGASLPMKCLLFLPFIIAALFYATPMVFDQEKSKRKKVDDKSQKLNTEFDKAERESAAHEGEVSRLEKEKAEQLANLEKEDPASFHNKRPTK